MTCESSPGRRAGPGVPREGTGSCLSRDRAMQKGWMCLWLRSPGASTGGRPQRGCVSGPGAAGAGLDRSRGSTRVVSSAPMHLQTRGQSVRRRVPQLCPRGTMGGHAPTAAVTPRGRNHRSQEGDSASVMGVESRELRRGLSQTWCPRPGVRIGRRGRVSGKLGP